MCSTQKLFCIQCIEKFFHFETNSRAGTESGSKLEISFHWIGRFYYLFLLMSTHRRTISISNHVADEREKETIVAHLNRRWLKKRIEEIQKVADGGKGRIGNGLAGCLVCFLNHQHNDKRNGILIGIIVTHTRSHFVAAGLRDAMRQRRLWKKKKTSKQRKQTRCIHISGEEEANNIKKLNKHKWNGTVEGTCMLWWGQIRNGSETALIS